jgi:hypothetical protein
MAEPCIDCPARVSPDGKTKLIGAITGKDNITLDIVRIFFALSGAVFMFLSIYSVLCKGRPFDGLAFCQGAALLITGAGAALGLKGRTEPDARPYADVPPRQDADRGPS